MRAPFFLLALCAVAAVAQSQSGRIVIQTSTILDGKGGVLRNRQIVIEGSKIQAVTEGKEKATYDLRNLTVMPGWIDTHVHINWHMDANRKSVSGGEKPEDAALYTAGDAWLTLEGGFTTVQSLGAAIDAVVRDRINQGVLPGPRILTSIRQINERSGDSPEALRALVRRTKSESADVIKLFASDGPRRGWQSEHDRRADSGRLRGGQGEWLARCRSCDRRLGNQGSRSGGVYLHRARHVHPGFHARSDGSGRGTCFDPNLLVLHNYLDNRASYTFNEQALATLEKGITPTLDALRRARAHKVKVVFMHRCRQRRIPTAAMPKSSSIA